MPIEKIKILLAVLELPAKGQLISKCLFGVFNFFQKWRKTRCIVVKTNSFVRFLEEFTPWQFAFEINWPLKSTANQAYLPRKWAKWAKLAALFSW
jgi:hypothetical protein